MSVDVSDNPVDVTGQSDRVCTICNLEGGRLIEVYIALQPQASRCAVSKAENCESSSRRSLIRKISAEDQLR